MRMIHLPLTLLALVLPACDAPAIGERSAPGEGDPRDDGEGDDGEVGRDEDGRDDEGRGEDGHEGCDEGGEEVPEDVCADWEAKAFTRAADQTSAEFQDLLPQLACEGPQYVRFDSEQKLWVGLVACDSGGYRFYLSDEPDGTYLPATDAAGHGQDFCELVDPAFTLGNEDDIASGSCPTCSIGTNVPLEGIEVYVRSVLGEPFERLVAPFWSYQTAIVSCEAGPRECVDEHEPGDICGDVELHVFGIYDAYDSATDQNGVANVHIDRPGPVRLFLASYSAAVWNVTAGPDTVLVDIVAHGYEVQSIVAPEGVPTTALSFEETNEFLGCGYEYPDTDPNSGCETDQLLPLISETMGQPVSSFTGCYAASEFTLDAELTATSNCATDLGYVQTGRLFCG